MTIDRLGKVGTDHKRTCMVEYVLQKIVMFSSTENAVNYLNILDCQALSGQGTKIKLLPIFGFVQEWELR